MDEDMVTRIAQALMGEYGPMDIDADLDRWYFEKATSPADVVRFVLKAASDFGSSETS